MARKYMQGWLLLAAWAFVGLFATVDRCWADNSTNRLRVSVGPDPKLAVAALTNGQVQLLLTCEADAMYVIEFSPDLIQWTPVATNSDNSSSRLITVVAPANANYYRASRGAIPMFTFALAAVSGLIGSTGCETSSWNSHDTNNVQDLNGQYNGYIGTNGNVALETGFANMQNASILGNLFLGPTATFNSSTPPSGTIYTGWNGTLPDVAMPIVDANGNSIFWTPAPTIIIGSGKNAKPIHDLTTSGFYIALDSSPIVVESGVTAILDLHIPSWSPTNITINGGTTNAGTLIVYQEIGSANFQAASGAINNRPENFIYFGLPSVTTLNFSGSTTFVGLIYAPESNITLSGGGIGNTYIGSMVGKTITVNGHFSFHYDESLLTSGPYR